MKVERRDNVYSVYFEKDEDSWHVSAESPIEAKNRFVKWMADLYDEAISLYLGLSFPYTIGERTFYNLSELEDYIKFCQKELNLANKYK